MIVMAMKALPTCACLAIRGVKMMFMWRIWRRFMMVMIVPLDHSALLGQMMMMMIVLIMIDDHNCDDHEDSAYLCSVWQEEV